MTPAAFIEKWGRSELRERQGSQSHFNDLCALIGEPNPTDADPLGTSYCFERGASKVGGGDGWADVWKRACFGWEYKGKHKDLNAALRQLQIYAPDLENPPYLVVCDMERIVVHTNWTNTVRRTLNFDFDDLREPAKLDQLRQVFRGSSALKPGLSPQELTAKVAARFGELGKQLQEREHDPQAVAHFLNRLIFCMFAEDAEILPKNLFTRMVQSMVRSMRFSPANNTKQFDDLFAKMGDGGFFGADEIRWFNGGLFNAAKALPLERADLDLIAETAGEHDWSNIDPAVFGTMFEEALKTSGRRAALGAHYTDREKILKIVEPVVIRPLTTEWEIQLAAIRTETEAMAKAEAERKTVLEEAASKMTEGAAAFRAGEATRRKILAAIAKRRDAALGRATELRDAFLAKLAAFRVLDPACGSGNFLYVALHAVRDIELRALLDADRLGVPQVAPRVGLDAVRGIEIEPYAAELARITLWIGNLQWQRRNGYTTYAEPVLDTLNSIECRDALLNPDDTEATWPEADVIIGNPPFLGGGDQLRDLKPGMITKLRSIYHGRVPGRADLCIYWVQKATEFLQNSQIKAFGFLATKSITKGVSRSPLDTLFNNGELIYDAWTNQPWTLQGANVRVSLICAAHENTSLLDLKYLNGEIVTKINPDLTAGIDITRAKPLKENLSVAFQGVKLTGPFDITGKEARSFLVEPANVNGKYNCDVVKRLFDIDDIVGRDSDRWVADFGLGRSEDEVSKYEKPFETVGYRVKKYRNAETQERTEKNLRQKYWEFERYRPNLRNRITGLSRYIVTPESSEHRIFIFVESNILIQGSLFAIAKDDGLSFGILSSKIHEVWATAQGNKLGVGNQRRYNIGVAYKNFPFPDGMTPNITAQKYFYITQARVIAKAAIKLHWLRKRWLNPTGLTRIEPEVVPGYPDRILPKDAAAAKTLKTLTLTNLYNMRPTWLDNAHRRLDAAVAAAYGWPADLPDDEILARLFALNQERAAAGR